MNKESMPTLTEPAQIGNAISVDEAIADYLERLNSFRSVRNAEDAVKLHNEFKQYIRTLSGEDRTKAADAFVHSL